MFPGRQVVVDELWSLDVARQTLWWTWIARSCLADNSSMVHAKTMPWSSCFARLKMLAVEWFSDQSPRCALWKNSLLAFVVFSRKRSHLYQITFAIQKQRPWDKEEWMEVHRHLLNCSSGSPRGSICRTSSLQSSGTGCLHKWALKSNLR